MDGELAEIPEGYELRRYGTNFVYVPTQALIDSVIEQSTMPRRKVNPPPIRALNILRTLDEIIENMFFTDLISLPELELIERHTHDIRKFLQSKVLNAETMAGNDG